MRCEATVGARKVLDDGEHRVDRQRPIQVREQHRVRVGGHTRFPTERAVDPSGVDSQQNQIGATGEQPVCRKVDLSRCGQMYETFSSEGLGNVLPSLLGGGPLLASADVDENGRAVTCCGTVHTPQASAGAHGKSAVSERTSVHLRLSCMFTIGGNREKRRREQRVKPKRLTE